MNDLFYFRQLLAGRDYAEGDELARSMRNFTYVIGDRQSREAVLVDPAYDPAQLVDLLRADEMNLVGVLATHYHPDHVGGSLTGHQHVAGIAELLETAPVPIHVHEDEASWIVARTGVERGALVNHRDGDRVKVGSVEVTLMHTPGHTPGSQCLFVEGCLLSGDTLFLDGCGRTDLPGGSSVELYRTLRERLGKISDEVVLYPGHLYSREPSLTMGAVRQRNSVFAPRDVDQWIAAFGP